MTMAKFMTLFDWDTVQSADSTEWCPLSPHQKVFVCGTYQIEKKVEGDSSQELSSPPTSRLGRIHVFEISVSEELKPHQVIDLPAILDMKWCQKKFSEKILIGVVTATGKLLIFELGDDKNLSQVTESQIVADSSKEVLALSLDWSCAKSLCGPSQIDGVSIVVSDSQGGVNIFKLSYDLKLDLIKRVQCHEYEAWIAAFNYWEPTVIFSGGDDSLLKGWDTRAGLETPTFVNRTHSAGVTSLQSNPLFEHILVSGSYDEQLRLWDLRKMRHPLHSLNLSGGVWRVKWDPFSCSSILSACMHGGFHVIDCKNALLGKGSPVVSASYANHESLAYGADWSHLSPECCLSLLIEDASRFVSESQDIRNPIFITTCSFYDHKLCVSALNPSPF